MTFFDEREYHFFYQKLLLAEKYISRG